MKYVNPYEIAKFIHFTNLDTTTFKKFKRRLSAELELNDDEIIVSNVSLQKNEIYEILDNIDRDKSLLNIYKALYENQKLNDFLNGKLNITDIKKLKNILFLEDKETINFITPYLIDIFSKLYKDAFSKNNIKILEVEPPSDESNYEKIYEPIYKILKNKENELINLKNNYYDFDDIKNITGNIETINALPAYFTKIRSDIAQAIRNLSIDSWNDNEDLELALKLINYTLKLNVNTKTKDKFLSDKEDLENIQLKIVSEDIADKINNLQNNFNLNVASEVKAIIKNTFNDDIVGITIRDLSIFAWNKKENIEVALELNRIAINITESQDVLKILNKDKKDLEKIKKDNTCWYCQKNLAIDNKYYAALDIWKYEETGVLGSIVGAISGRKYFKNTIPVPRCKKCYDEHNDYGFFDFGLKKKAKQKTESYLYEIPELTGWNIGSSPN